MASPQINPNVAKAGGIMAVSILLSRILGIVREAIIADLFGQSVYTDAYLLAFNIPDLLFFLIAGGALSSAFIPVFSEYLHTGKEKEAWHVFSAVACIMSLAVTGFIIVAWVAAPLLTRFIAPGTTNPEEIALITHLSRILLPTQFAFFIGGLLFGTLYARQIFTVPGLGPNIYNLGIILGAVVLSALLPLPVVVSGADPVTRSITGPAWGALVGAFLGNLLIPLFVIRHLKADFKFTLDTKHPGVCKVFRLMAPVVFGLSLPGVFALFLKTLADLYPEPGLPTAFNTANQLMQAPLGVFGQALALGAFPALSQFVAQNRMDAYRDQLTKTLRTVLYLTVPISVLLAASATDIIAAVFQSGQFTPADTDRTAPLLVAFAAGVPFWCLQPVLMRGFFALQNTLRPILLGTATTAIFLTLAFTVWQTGLPPYALASAGSVAAVVLVVFLVAALKKEVPGTDLTPLVPTALKSLLASVPAAVVFWGAFRLLGPLGLSANKLANLAVLAVFGLAAAWAYYFATKALKMPETTYLDRALKRKRAANPDGPSTPTEED